jgi:phosphoenolpyruvate carboxykinase (GTP)
MVLKHQGVDIVLEIGGITILEAAWQLFETKMDAVGLARIRTIQNPAALLKIANAVAMCGPDSVFVHTGSEADRRCIRELAIQKGEESLLAMENHTIHFDLREEQGRILDRTFYIANETDIVNTLANKMLRQEALKEVRDRMTDIMQGKIMLVGFYSRGPVGAPVSNPAIEITSSAYVTHSAELLYRNNFASFDAEVSRAGYFYTNIHSEGRNRPEDLPNARVFMDRGYQTTYSFNCTYAGNTLLLKKGNHRFSVDRAVYENRGNELSEHMFITGIAGPKGRITWCAGAAPSGCGKTTTAMAGSHFVGDDLAQMWIDNEGAVRSISPECGIFGILEDVNREGDPHLMDILRKPGTEVIWSNVLVDPQGVPHWAGNGEKTPLGGRNFQGDWELGKIGANGKPVPISHSNSRCTLSSKALANYSDQTENPQGVETRIITYSGRDSNTMPPVWEARNADEGVVIGACIVSKATATEVGASGVKRAPWANAPFIPGAIGDYMDAQFRFFGNPRIAENKRPVIAGLNYFLTDEARGGSGKELLGEKRDVSVWLAWLEKRVHREAGAIETPIGFIPRYPDLKELFTDVIGKDYPEELYVRQFSLYVSHIVSRIDLQIDAYAKEVNVPRKLFDILQRQRQELTALEKTFGQVILPEQLEAIPAKR